MVHSHHSTLSTPWTRSQALTQSLLQALVSIRCGLHNLFLTNTHAHGSTQVEQGTMGYGVPAAMGAKVGAPDTTVWAIDGDGCFQMTNQELLPAH